MSQPPTRGEIFDRVLRETMDNWIIAAPSYIYDPWVAKRLRDYEQGLKFPHLRNMTLEEYYQYRIQQRDKKLESAMTEYTPTDQQFWKAVYDYNPLEEPNSAKMVEYLASGRLGPIIIGKLYGEKMMKLVPGIGVLSAAPLEGEPSLDFAATDSGAIYYPDGHPTQEIISARFSRVQTPQTSTSSSAKRPVTSAQRSVPRSPTSRTAPYPSSRRSPSDEQLKKRRSRELTESEINTLPQRTPSPQQYAPSSSRTVPAPTMGPQRDDKLRRCAALGWIIMENSDGDWKRTGHVMVIDMDDRDIRQRQPWLILAPEWPTDGVEMPDGTFTHRADDVVRRDDRSVAGVFPGDQNRTTICCIRPQDPRVDMLGQPVLQCLGPGFKFNPVRLGGHRASRPTDHGPGLVRMMEWYWDPAIQREVCFTQDGMVYMTYDTTTKEYTYPNFSTMSFAGEQGLFGEIQEPPSLEVHGYDVPLGHRMRGMTGILNAPHPQDR
ncbi:MAG: hypothetical protein Q9198_004364, partial [Flavoplaca austrocitrina]